MSALLTADTFAFLGDLSTLRDKAWFEANRSRYQAHLLEPMRGLVTAVGPRLQAQIPTLEWRPQVNKTLTRINRDMRFARGQSPYKDHMLALFYREGRKKDDPQLFVGVQPGCVWVGLYLSPAFLGHDSPMSEAVAGQPDAVVALGQGVGIGADLMLGSCRRYGEVEQTMDGAEAGHYLAGPHLCALKTYTVEEVVADGAAFVDGAGEILVRLVPLWRAYLEGV